MESQVPSPRLLEQVRKVMRLHHYSIHTERSYVDWIKRFVHFHRMKSRDDLAEGEAKNWMMCRGWGKAWAADLRA